MTPRPVPPRNAKAAVACLVLSVAACSTSNGDHAHDAVAASPSVTTSRGLAVERFRSVREPPSVPVPLRVRIPGAGVDAPVIRIGRLPDGTLEAPKSWTAVGWYADGPRPGQPGPAVLLGHVDSRDGPAVFYRLGQLRKGAEVVVDTAEGSRQFVVQKSVRVPKNHFPTEAVYLPTLRPLLQLITCGGSFDAATGHYRDNIVVTAALEP